MQSFNLIHYGLEFDFVLFRNGTFIIQDVQENFIINIPLFFPFPDFFHLSFFVLFGNCDVVGPFARYRVLKLVFAI